MQRQYLYQYKHHLYSNHFGSHKGFVIYNSFAAKAGEDIDRNLCVYSGNIGVGRSSSLLEVGHLITKVFNKKLSIFSTQIGGDDYLKLKNDSAINFCGSVTYEENLALLNKSLFCLHVESFDDFYLMDTKHAFSGKIPDCLSCGRPLVFYGPKTTTCYRYLSNNKCGFVASNIDELQEAIKHIINNDHCVTDILDNAKKISENNHNKEKNANMFVSIIESI